MPFSTYVKKVLLLGLSALGIAVFGCLLAPLLTALAALGATMLLVTIGIVFVAFIVALAAVAYLCIIKGEPLNKFMRIKINRSFG